MNKIYKLVWSKVKNSYVVASELAKSHTKSPKSGVMNQAVVSGVLACVMACGAVFPVYAAGQEVIYDDDTNTTITLQGATGVGTKITNLKDGDISAGSHDAVTGRQLYAVQQDVDTFQSSLSSLNTTIASTQTLLNNTKTKVSNMENLLNTTATVVETGFNININGAKVKTVNPDSNYINFVSGKGITLSNSNNGVKIDVSADGVVASGDTGAITGGLAYTELRPADGNYVVQANTTAQNLTALDTQLKTTTNNLATEVSNRESADTTLQTNITAEETARIAGDTALSDRIGTLSVDGNYIHQANNVNQNMSALDTAVNNLSDGKADVSLSNIDNAGKTVVRNLAKDSVKVVAGTHTTVTEGADGDAKTYAVNVTADGVIERNNTGLVSGGTIWSELNSGRNLGFLDQIGTGTYAWGGKKNIVSGTDSMSIGADVSKISGSHSFALGSDGAQITGNHSVVLNSVDINYEDYKDDPDYYNRYLADDTAGSVVVNGNNSTAIGTYASIVKNPEGSEFRWSSSGATQLNGNADIAIGGTNNKLNSDKSIVIGGESNSIGVYRKLNANSNNLGDIVEKENVTNADSDYLKNSLIIGSVDSTIGQIVDANNNPVAYTAGAPNYGNVILGGSGSSIYGTNSLNIGGSGTFVTGDRNSAFVSPGGRIIAEKASNSYNLLVGGGGQTIKNASYGSIYNSPGACIVSGSCANIVGGTGNKISNAYVDSIFGGAGATISNKESIHNYGNNVVVGGAGGSIIDSQSSGIISSSGSTIQKNTSDDLKSGYNVILGGGGVNIINSSNSQILGGGGSTIENSSYSTSINSPGSLIKGTVVPNSSGSGVTLTSTTNTILGSSGYQLKDSSNTFVSSSVGTVNKSSRGVVVGSTGSLENASSAVILGGAGNIKISDIHAANGWHNDNNTIINGFGASIYGGCYNTVIGGSGTIDASANGKTGNYNVVLSSGGSKVASIGDYNGVYNSGSSFVNGGCYNVIMGTGGSSIAGGCYNVILGSGGSSINNDVTYSTIIGGNSRHVNSNYAVSLAGGNIESNADYSFAFGNSTVSAESGIAFGQGNTVSGKQSIAIGAGNKVSKQNSIAVGTGLTVDGANSGAFGDPSVINANNSYSVGNSNTIGETGTEIQDVFVLGNNVTATNTDTVILGSNSEAKEDHVVSVGRAEVKDGDTVIQTAINRRIVNVGAGVNDTDAVNVKQLKDATLDFGINRGWKEYSSETSGDSYVLGELYGTYSISAYNSFKDSYTDTNLNGEGAVGPSSIAIGRSATAQELSVTIGEYAKGTAEAKHSVTIGAGADSKAAWSTVTGFNAQSDAENGTAYGSYSYAAGIESTAIGTTAIANAYGDVAIGTNAYTKAIGTNPEGNVAIGYYSNAYGSRSIAIGADAYTAEMTPRLDENNQPIDDQIGGISIGESTESYNGSVVVGSHSRAVGYESAAFGVANTAHGEASTALGFLSSAYGKNSVALGSRSTAMVDDVISIGHKADDSYNMFGEHDTDYYRRIINMADGVDAHDAATVGQLNSQRIDFVGINTDMPEWTDETKDAIMAKFNVNSEEAYNTLRMISNNHGQGADEENAIAVGYRAGSHAISSTAIGTCSLATSQNSIALGTSASAGANSEQTGDYGYNSIAIGYQSQSRNHDALAIGSCSATYGAESVALGYGTMATNTNAVAIGSCSVNSHGIQSVAIGSCTSASANQSIAIGVCTSASANSAVAIGDKAGARSLNAVSLGTSAEATNPNSTALGSGAKAYNTNAIAVGNGLLSAGNASIAIGTNDIEVEQGQTVPLRGAVSEGSIAIGRNVFARNTNAMALGTNADVISQESIAIGTCAVAGYINQNNSADGDYAIAIGRNASALFGQAIAIGDCAIVTPGENTTTAQGGIAIGGYSEVSDNDGIAIGRNTKAYRSSVVAGVGSQSTSVASVVIGSSAKSYSHDSIALGTGAVVGDSAFNGSESENESYNVAVGANTLAKGGMATALGDWSQAQGYGSNALGFQSRATGFMANAILGACATADNTIAIGPNASAESKESLAIGLYTHANGGDVDSQGSVAIGYGDNTNSEYSTSLGVYNTISTKASYTSAVGYANRVGTYDATDDDTIIYSSAFGALNHVTGDKSTALGYNNTLSGNSSLAVGSCLTVVGNNSGAFGDPSVINGDNSYSVGNNNTIAENTSDVFVLGNNVATSVSDVIVLGKDSAGEVAGTVSLGRNAYTKTVHNDQTGEDEEVTVPELTRRITHVTAGINDTDAVNVSQLNELSDIVTANKTHFFGVNSTNEYDMNYNGGGAEGTNAIAVGSNAWAGGDNSIAVGTMSGTFTGQQATAVGYIASAIADKATALGNQAQAVNTSTVAVGDMAAASGQYSTAIGAYSHAKAKNSIAIGSDSYAETEDEVSFGRDAIEANPEIGQEAHAEIKRRLTHVDTGINDTDAVNVKQLNDSISGAKQHYIGVTSSAEGEADLNYNGQGASGVDAVALGPSARATAESSMALGDYAKADGLRSIAVGNSAGATNDYGIAIGGLAKAQADGAVALGTSANSTAANALAIGNSSKAEGATSYAIGQAANAKGESAIAFGTSTEAALTGVAIGHMAKAVGESSVAIGTGTNAAKTAIALGHGANASVEAATAIGINSSATANHAVAIGTGSVASEVNTVSFGNTTTKRRLVNIADGTAENDAVNYKQLTLEAIARENADTALSNRIGTIAEDKNYILKDNSLSDNLVALDTQLKNTIQNLGGLSSNAVIYDNEEKDIITLAGTGNGTKITNLKSGSVTANSKDAITGSQLYAVKQDISGFADDIRRNSDNIRSLNSSVTSALSSVAASGLLVDTMDVSKADSSLNNLTESGKRVLKQYAENAVQEYMAAQQGTNSAPMAPMMYAGNPNTLSVTDAGNGSLHVGEGSYVNGTSSIAIGVGNQVNANNSGAFGDPSIINADASYVLGNDDTINTGATGSFIVGNDGVSDAKGGLLFGSNTKATAEAENGLALGNAAEVSAKNSVALGSGSVADVENVISVGNNDLRRKIVNMADGAIAEDSHEAITGAQLFVTNEKVQKNVDAIELNKQEIDKKANVDASNINTADWATKLGIGKVEEGNKELVTGGTVYDAVKDMKAVADFVKEKDGVISIAPNSAATKIHIGNSANEGRVLTGVVTDANDVTSAANVGYVNSVATTIANDMNRGFNRVNDRMDKVGAGAAAMAGLVPGPMDGDEKWSFSAAVGNYRSATAGAVGAFYKPTDNVMVAVKGSFGNDENMVSGGIGVSLNKGNVPGVSKAQLVRTINAQAEKMQQMESNYEGKLAMQKNEIAAVRAENASMQKMMMDMQARLEALEKK